MKRERRYKNAGVGIAIGVALGTSLGLAFDNFPVGISVGVALGSLYEAYNRRKQEEISGKPATRAYSKPQKMVLYTIAIACLVLVLILLVKVINR